MKLRGPISSDLINLFKGIIDIYPCTLPGGKIIWVARKWPRKPRDRSGNFGRTHAAAKLTTDTYRQLCPRVKSYYKRVFREHHLHQYPLDYWRAVNQSWAYQSGSLPAIICASAKWEKQNWLLTLKHTPGATVRLGFRPVVAPRYPTQTVKVRTRRGPKNCTKLTTTIPENTLPPVSASDTETMFRVPDRTLAVPYIDTAPAETHTITIKSRDTKDASLYNYVPNYNTGNLGQLTLYYYEPRSREVRIIIDFNLPPLPAGAEIVSATIKLIYHSGNTDIYSPTWAIITENWEEMEVSWNNRKAGTPWTTPGGTYRDEQFCPYTFDGSWFEFDATALVKSYYEDFDNSHGFLLIPDHSQFTSTSFRSSEYTIFEHIPEISITYKTGGELPKNTPRFFPILFWYPDHPRF